MLFCDLVNSTSLAERIGAEAMHTLLNQFFEPALTRLWDESEDTETTGTGPRGCR